MRKAKNKYRLVTGIYIAKQGKKDIIYTLWIGTHVEYDKIDANQISKFPMNF
jgi:mRNA interferase HigB